MVGRIGGNFLFGFFKGYDLGSFNYLLNKR